MRYSAIIPAGGSSSRYSAGNKLFQILNGKPVILYAVIQFRKFCRDQDIVIPVHKDFLSQTNDLLSEYLPGNKIQLVPGGADRTRSVLNAVESLSPGCDLTAVHDAARPLIREETILSVYNAAEIHSAAAAARPVTNTLKQIEGGLLSSGSIRRETIWEIETPQTFLTDLLRKSLQKTVSENLSFTDDSAAVEYFSGIKTFPVQPEEINLKITHFSDFSLADALIKLQNS